MTNIHGGVATEYSNKRGGAKSGFLDKGVSVTQPPMDQMT